MLTKCPICGYSLDGLPARHSCPECGFDYDKSMRPFDGLRRHLWRPPKHTLPVLLVLALGIATVWICSPASIGKGMLIPAVICLIPLGISVLEFLRPSDRARQIFFSEDEIVIVRFHGEPLRFAWTQLGRAEKSRIDGAVRIMDIDDNQVASVHRRSFTTDWFAGRLVDQINGAIEASRTDT